MRRKPLAQEMDGAISPQIPLMDRMIHYSLHLDKCILTPYEMYTTGFNLFLDCPTDVRLGFCVTFDSYKQRRLASSYGWPHILICAVGHYEKGKRVRLTYEKIPEGFQ